MKKDRRYKRFNLIKLEAAICIAAVLFTACGSKITDEMIAEREAAIIMMENGDYEGAAAKFDRLVEAADSVTDFEIDILKYRAEAEFKLNDFAAAAYTYDILNQVDEERAEYCYFGAAALAKAGDLNRAELQIEAGKKLDKNEERPGFTEAVMALAEARTESDDLDGAQELYRELIDHGHGNTTIYNQWMLLFMDAGEYEEAIKLAMEGQSLTDNDSMKELKFNEAVCYEYLGDFSKALELFRNYTTEYGSDERAEHEIAFLETR